jgi:phosphoribosylpyrophosphate synthetase
MTCSFLTFKDGVRQVIEWEGSWDDNAPEVFQYPGGEWSLRNIPEFGEETPITWSALVRGGSVEDLLKAALLADMARQRGDRFVLLLPYVPAARADKGLQEARVYARFINSMVKASTDDQVVILDPHSPYVVGELARPKQLDLPSLVKTAIGDDKYDAVIAPDHGARARANLVADALGLDVYTADKTRDFDTGKILGIKVPLLSPQGRYLVVDDICDGGGTFISLANEARIPRHRMGLWVEHGIFSGTNEGMWHLRNRYASIYTTDSHPGHSRVGCATTLVPLLPALMKECQ